MTMYDVDLDPPDDDADDSWDEPERHEDQIAAEDEQYVRTQPLPVEPRTHRATCTCAACDPDGAYERLQERLWRAA